MQATVSTRTSISKSQILCLGVVLLGCAVLMGDLRPLYRSESYLSTGVPLMIIEIVLALVFAPDWVKSVFADDNTSGQINGILRVAILPLGAVMPATIITLFANQALDRSPGVSQTLQVTRAYSDVHKGSAYYAVVPAARPSRWLSSIFGTQTEIAVPRVSWQKLVPGRSTVTLKVHPGRFGLPWYDIDVTAT